MVDVHQAGGMATVSRMVQTGPARVFDVLADGWSYTGWVVGTSHMRAVSAAWPGVGARLHHSVGMWPLLLQDESEVEVSDPPRRLVLVAKGRPLGQARVDIRLTAEGSGTRVTMDETVISGPGRFLPDRLVEPLIKARNREALGRLAALAEQPATPD